MARRNGIPSGAFMASFSSAGRIAAPMICCNCQTKAARWNSLYCSDACHRVFLDVAAAVQRMLTPKESTPANLSTCDSCYQQRTTVLAKVGGRERELCQSCDDANTAKRNHILKGIN
jgi:hypothetical protein